MRSVLIVALMFTPAVGAAQGAQAPWRGENLQYFPKDIRRPDLIQRMREFSFALDVRCQYCHDGPDGPSFDGCVYGGAVVPTAPWPPLPFPAFPLPPEGAGANGA